MKAIIEELLKYDLIKPIGNFKPMGPISHIEIQPVRQHEDYCEPCEPGEKTFWSVYARYDPAKNAEKFGGVDCIADCSDFNAAVNIAGLIAALLNIEIVGA